ncbi:PRD domain-containing protein [Sporolactobacillus sp. THM7-7]|nr:PRD domain-containing protein [Sporolactobacillus sp. THM7-7]
MRRDEWKNDYLKFSVKSSDALLFKDIICEIRKQLDDRNVILTQSQTLGIASHVSGMIQRSHQGKKMKVENKALFSDVSNDSLELATQICCMIRNISEDEKYLLSIHFENAKLEQIKRGE